MTVFLSFKQRYHTLPHYPAQLICTSKPHSCFLVIRFCEIKRGHTYRNYYIQVPLLLLLKNELNNRLDRAIRVNLINNRPHKFYSFQASFFRYLTAYHEIYRYLVSTTVTVQTKVRNFHN